MLSVQLIDFFYAHQNLIAQIFGFIAMGIAISMYQFKKHKTILIMMTVCACVWSLHFACLGLYTPVAMNTVNAVRSIVYGFRDKKWASGKIIPIIFLFLCAGSVVLTWENIKSILPFIASIFATLGNWQQNTKILKLMTIPVCVCWFIYNVLNGSVAGALNETFTLISIAVFFIRIRKTEQEKVLSK